MSDSYLQRDRMLDPERGPGSDLCQEPGDGGASHGYCGKGTTDISRSNSDPTCPPV